MVHLYEIKFEDGSYTDYSANVLIKNLYYHIDNHGYSHGIIKGITDHRISKHAIPILSVE